MLEQERENFENAMRKWKDNKIVGAFFSFLSGVVNIFAGIDPTKALSEIEKLAEIIKVMVELFKLVKAVKSVEDINVDLKGEAGIDNITANPTTDFTKALQSAVELKLKLPKFDEMKNFADDTLKRIDDITDHEIEGTDKLITAYKNVADIGKRLAYEVRIISIILKV